MSVSISGILLDPYGQPARFAEVKFITWQGANDVLTTSNSVFKTSEDGAYSFSVEFGTFTVQVRYNQSNGKFQTIKQKVIVNSTTTASTLGELLLFNEPLTPPEIAYVEQLVAEAEGYRDESAVSAAESAASAQDSLLYSQNAQSSANNSAQSAADAANSAAAIVGVPLNGGVWASGQTFTAYNQYMIYNGTPYAPLTSTPLDYGPVGATPDFAFVGPYPLNDHSKLSNRNVAGAHSSSAVDMGSGNSLANLSEPDSTILVGGVEASKLTAISDRIYNSIGAYASEGGLILAIVGDSTAAGVPVGSTYGELNTDVGSGYSKMFQSLAMSTNKNFTPPLERYGKLYKRSSYLDFGIDAAFPHYSLVATDNPETDKQSLSLANGQLSDKITIYHNSRTADAAALFDVLVTDPLGTTIDTFTVDTYQAATSFGGVGPLDKGTSLTSSTFTLPTLEDEVFIEIKNVRVVDRGSGIPADGTAIYYGSSLGNGVQVHNLAVSSTTLLNNSSANQIRGVTTDERLSKAYALNPNAIILNWATNDSKVGVSTPEAFYLDLVTRIDEIRQARPGINIILATAPTGSAGSIYENNFIYFEKVRQAARVKSCALFDTENILSPYNRSEVVSDDVHPSRYGYKIVSSALSKLCGVSGIPRRLSQVPSVRSILNGSSIGSDFSGNWVLIHDEEVGRSVNPSQLKVEVGGNVFRASANIELMEVAVEFSLTPGGTAPSGATRRFSFLTDSTGDAWGDFHLSYILQSSSFFKGGQYYIKVFAKNYSFRAVSNAGSVITHFENI